MARFDGHDAGADARARQRQVAHAIERLVPHELVGPTQRRVHQAGIVQHHRILRRGAANQSTRAQRLHFVHESEGPRIRQLARECIRCDSVSPMLSPDRLVRKLDGDVEVQRIRRKGLVLRVALGETHGLS